MSKPLQSVPAVVGIVQPWAWGVIHGPQRELLLRKRATRLGIHLVFTSKARQFLTPAACSNLPGLPPAEQLTFGAFVGTVEVVRCERVRADWRWTFANPRPIEPIPLQNGTLRGRAAAKIWNKLRYLG
jgi:hypothetical protein